MDKVQLTGVPSFKPDSKSQLNGYLAFEKWARDKGYPIPENHQSSLVLLYLLQQQIDMHEQWVEILGGSLSDLRLQVATLIRRNQELESDIEQLKSCQPQD